MELLGLWVLWSCGVAGVLGLLGSLGLRGCWSCGVAGVVGTIWSLESLCLWVERGQGLWHRNGGNRKSVRYQEIADSCSKELGVEEQLAKTSQELELMDRLVVGT